MAKKKILIVDDDADFVEIVRAKLEKSNFEVIAALEADEGLRKAGTEAPDLILLDVVMPKKDGYVFLLELKKRNPTSIVPVIVVTATSGMEELFQLEGVDDYVIKPFEYNDLLKKIKKALK